MEELRVGELRVKEWGLLWGSGRLARSDGRFKTFLSRGRDARAPSYAPALPVTPFPPFFSSPAWRAISRGPKGPFRVRRSGKARQGQGRCGAHGEAKPQAVRRRACLGSPQGDPPPAGFRGRAQAPYIYLVSGRDASAFASLSLVASLWVAPTLKGRLCSPSWGSPCWQKRHFIV